MIKSIFLCLSLVVSAAACGGDSSAGSCTTTSGAEIVCQDYVGASWSASGVEQACVQSGATYSADACPTTDRVGSCVVFGGADQEFVLRIYPPQTLQDAEGACANIPGEFTPG